MILGPWDIINDIMQQNNENETAL